MINVKRLEDECSVEIKDVLLNRQCDLMVGLHLQNPENASRSALRWVLERSVRPADHDHEKRPRSDPATRSPRCHPSRSVARVWPVRSKLLQAPETGAPERKEISVAPFFRPADPDRGGEMADDGATSIQLLRS